MRIAAIAVLVLALTTPILADAVRGGKTREPLRLPRSIQEFGEGKDRLREHLGDPRCTHAGWALFEQPCAAAGWPSDAELEKFWSKVD